jgi:hypothetical protein
LLPPILRSRNASGGGGVSDFMDSLRSLGRGQTNRHNEFSGPVLHGPVGQPSRPSTSPGLGARVVTETESQIRGDTRRRLATTVLLPTPDGPESTVSRAGTPPRAAMSVDSDSVRLASSST